MITNNRLPVLQKYRCQLIGTCVEQRGTLKFLTKTRAIFFMAEVGNSEDNQEIYNIALQFYTSNWKAS